MDTENTLKSAMEDKYYQTEEGRPDLEDAINNQSQGNTQYMRYWHGSMTIIRPGLMIFNIQQIYIFFSIILLILMIILFVLLIKKRIIC